MYENVASTSSKESRPVRVDRRTKAEIAFDKLKDKKVSQDHNYGIYINKTHPYVVTYIKICPMCHAYTKHAGY